MTDPQQTATAAAIVTTPGDREIHIERWFDGPRERVFALMTDPALIPEWWGPRDGSTEVDEMDVRVGGKWRFVCRTEHGDTAFRGEYREINAPESLVQTFEWEGLPGHISVESSTFEDHGERTKIVISSVFQSKEDRDGMVASGMEGGLNETYARFDELLARQA
jgi:uncharacterized protein YndB with AHSA1/START domain